MSHCILIFTVSLIIFDSVPTIFNTLPWTQIVMQSLTVYWLDDMFRLDANGFYFLF